jgi:hypothetical protein
MTITIEDMRTNIETQTVFFTLFNDLIPERRAWAHGGLPPGQTELQITTFLNGKLDQMWAQAVAQGDVNIVQATDFPKIDPLEAVKALSQVLVDEIGTGAFASGATAKAAILAKLDKTT